MKRNAIIGALVWFGTWVATLANRLDLTWIELLFLFAPLVIVPLAIELIDRTEGENSAAVGELLARRVQFPAALLAVIAIIFAPGRLAALLAFPWLFVCALFALGGCARIFRGAYAELDRLFPAISLLSLAVGGAWFVASRLGLNPMGFQEPIVLLTAVHFHYAGFAAPLLARSANRALRRLASGSLISLLFRAVMIGVLVGPCMLALGFVLGPRLKLAAALILAVSEIGLAAAFVRVLPALRRIGAEFFLTIAAASVGFSMVLAAVWAVGEYPLQPFVHLDQMEKLHGTANAFGFSLSGLLAWILAAKGESLPEESST